MVALWLTAAAQDCTVRGVVTDEATGQPVVGVQISAANATDVFTDNSGSFCLTTAGAPPSSTQITKAGYLNVTRHWQAKADGFATELTLKLVPLSEFSGQVLDEDGHPMAGVLIYTGSAHRTTTDAEGRYQISDLVPGDYELYCRLPQTTREKAMQRNEKTGEVLGYSDTYYFR
jgi:hypothetical protein